MPAVVMKITRLRCDMPDQFNRAFVLPGSPATLPKSPPPSKLPSATFFAFKLEFQALEKSLQAKRHQSPKNRRIIDPNLVYSDVSKGRALPVQSAVTKVHAVVIEVSEDAMTISYAPRSPITRSEAASRRPKCFGDYCTVAARHSSTHSAPFAHWPGLEDPRSLHGVSSVGPGDEHVGKLRSSMMAAMRWNKTTQVRSGLLLTFGHGDHVPTGMHSRPHVSSSYWTGAGPKHESS